MTEENGRRLLTVLHAAERTGPPLLALRFLRWLRQERPDWHLDTLFLDGGGELTTAFEELGTVVVADPVRRTSSSWKPVHAANRALSRQLAGLGTIDLAHVHCAGSMRVVPTLPPAPILCHVHELSVGLDFHLDRGARRHLTDAARYIAVSDAVRNELVGRFEIDTALVERQWGFVADDALSVIPDRTLPDGTVIGPDATFVVASGVRHWRKAPELFLRVARSCVERYPEREWVFAWVGGEHDEHLHRLAQAAGLDRTVRFIDHVADPLPWIAGAEIFLLPAREDAFPLVSVEAAVLGRPLVSFDSGGTPELISAASCGRVVKFPDVDAMADVLDELAAAPERRAELGDAGAEFARAQLTLAAAGPRMLRTIERTMDRR